MDGRGRLGLLAGPEHGRTRSTFRAGYAGVKKNLAFFLPPAPESDSDFRPEPENSDYHELENLIFNQRAFPTLSIFRYRIFS
jgi:hypothetical protein